MRRVALVGMAGEGYRKPAFGLRQQQQEDYSINHGSPEYTYEEFEGIALRLIKKLHPNAVIQIASSVWKTGIKDIRDVLKIAKLCNPSDTEEDVTRLISIHHKYRKTGKEYN